MSERDKIIGLSVELIEKTKILLQSYLNFGMIEGCMLENLINYIYAKNPNQKKFLKKYSSIEGHSYVFTNNQYKLSLELSMDRAKEVINIQSENISFSYKYENFDMFFNLYRGREKDIIELIENVTQVVENSSFIYKVIYEMSEFRSFQSSIKYDDIKREEVKKLISQFNNDEQFIISLLLSEKYLKIFVEEAILQNDIFLKYKENIDLINLTDMKKLGFSKNEHIDHVKSKFESVSDLIEKKILFNNLKIMDSNKIKSTLVKI